MNDQEKFLNVVKQFPEVWDRNHPHFREKIMKERSWSEISRLYGNKEDAYNLINISEDACRDFFKALREKYLREREKRKTLGNMYVPWPLLKSMEFLEPHIVLRKQASTEEAVQKAEAFSQSFFIDPESDLNYKDFDVQLVALVRQATPIWDRSAKTFSSKPLKQQLWRNLASKLGKHPHQCALRWKALREKYIRQKGKYQEGEGKWYLLDDMSFLDEVIQYRRKYSDRSGSSQNNNLNLYETFSSEGLPIMNPGGSNANNESFDRLTFDSENSMNDSSCEFPVTIKREDSPDVPDSSNGELSCPEQRKIHEEMHNGSEIPKKREKLEEESHNEQSPEQVFGNLVAVMLSKKSESDKNHAMVEIMTILTK